VAPYIPIITQEVIFVSTKLAGKQTFCLSNPPSVAASACVGSKKESEGPFSQSFDYISQDTYFGQKTWEKAESEMVRRAFAMALDKAKLSTEQVGCVFCGDLLNQCAGTSFGMRDTNIPMFGVYGACSTMAESLALAAMTVDGGYHGVTAAATSSHFSSAERQFRFPLEYGGVRTPTAQWTVTGAGAVILTSDGAGPYITHVTPGRLVDGGIKDANNMGAAMAPAAYDTIKAHLKDLGRAPTYYDLILTGDLGAVGTDILRGLFRDDGIDISEVHNDCGLMIYDLKKQDVHAGGSGCGCAASVLCGEILNGMRAGRWKRVLLAATGALMSPTTAQQGETIPSVCCAVAINVKKEG